MLTIPNEKTYATKKVIIVVNRGVPLCGYQHEADMVCE